MANKKKDRVQNFTDLDPLQIGIPGPGKFEKAGE
jgi:hypothetical protein